MKKLLLLVTLCLATAGCSDNKATNTETEITPVKKEIRIGTTPGMFADMVRDSIKPQLEKKGYKLELIEFSDYVRPNRALANGELDINVFQHKAYLDLFKEKNNLDIIEAFQVPTAPLGIYAGKLKTIENAPDGISISVANDLSNLARALVMLDKFGWIKLKHGINPLVASQNDIAENPKNVKIIEITAAQLPRSRDDVDLAVINGNYALDAGIKLTEALSQEPGFDFINWSAIKPEDKDSQWVKDITEAYNSEEFKGYTQKTFPGFKLPSNWN